MAVDDLIGTLSDNDVSDEESEVDEVEEVAPRGKGKKRKREAISQSAVKKQKGDNDADLDSDFEFENEGGAAELDDLDTWALAGNAANNEPGNIDAIIARKRAKQTPKAPAPDAEDDDDDSSNDSDDEGIAAAYDSEEEADEGGADGGEESEEEFSTAMEGLNGEFDGIQGSEEAEISGEDEGSEDEVEVAAHVPHPDDLADESGSEAAEDVVEKEKRNQFFANDAATTNPAATAFHTMNLSRPILRGLASVGFDKPTPIQAKSIPVALEGRDLVGGAETGSGKTGAFIIPILERLMFRPKRTATTRVVILMPTRELALQCFNVAKKLAAFTDITFGQAIGGLNSREQEKALKLRPDIVIATPGRFIDLERNSTGFDVSTVEILVLDEADRMLEEGFADELNEILTKIPKSRQTMLFSATMTTKVDDLIRSGLQRPVRLMVDSQQQTVKGLVQEFVRLRPGREKKRLAYLLHLCESIYTDRVIIFFRQKKEAHRVRVIFALAGLKAAELHGTLSQEQRINAIESFRTGKANFLLATDLASRGLDIKGIDTVINYEAPQSHEIYLHRVGRTARAGRTGRSCTLAAEPDRKVVKAAVKAGKAQGAVIKQRTIDAHDADAWHARIEAMADEIEDVLREEKEEKALNVVDKQLTKADNMVKYEDEIKSRPKKTWFESEKDKQAAKDRGRALLNGAEAMETKKQKGGKLSNKDKKKLQARDERKTGGEWKLGKKATLQGKESSDKKLAKVAKQKEKDKARGKDSKAKYIKGRK
ncbi:Putative ATP-dependent RNA helicase DEAD-box, Helicase superfamily 1/2, ATP-binding protein [Septoria linicola]|uniref:RNA helicase n=1 Tax=Septoria linicola TaxID=215465 RepID=A0A9Q9AIM1_9PEZI|nr:putative ATP-dependent RNA helicase DEAD-box, Helicase superfamily 1/2, ATP-binding protein [Septoria linicola]USW49730.1 Putative ATP-dependent RNA helicase DEAD-box, Helicase superfamily 1/2, ATP-binding protein [Septoria linicola]